MAGKSPVSASDEQRAASLGSCRFTRSREADRARAVLLTLAGWTSPKIAEAFGVREHTVRLWRSDFMRGGVAALKAHAAPCPAPMKSESSFAGGHALAGGTRGRSAQLDNPPAARRDRSACGCPHQPITTVQGAAKKKFRWRRPRHTLKGRQIADEIERVGLRLQVRKQQAEAGDIVLLYGDESEALTHPYLARVWAHHEFLLSRHSPALALTSLNAAADPNASVAWSPATQPATRTVRVTGSTRTPLIIDKSQSLVDAGEPRYVFGHRRQWRAAFCRRMRSSPPIFQRTGVGSRHSSRNTGTGSARPFSRRSPSDAGSGSIPAITIDQAASPTAPRGANPSSADGRRRQLGKDA